MLYRIFLDMHYFDKFFLVMPCLEYLRMENYYIANRNICKIINIKGEIENMYILRLVYWIYIFFVIK